MRKVKLFGGLFSSPSAKARRALDEGRLDDAERLLLDITRANPTSATDWWNLGLVYKFQRRWQEALDAFVRNAELRPAPEPYWNAGVAATALRNWTAARWAWRQLELDVGPGDGAPEADFGPGPFRLNPDGSAEVVWGTRIDPCRMRIRSVPLPESGHRYDDIVLHDVVPRGSRELRGQQRSVFDELERMEPAAHPTLRAELSWTAPEDERALYALFDDPAYGAENWTSSIEMLCAQCSLAAGHEHASEDGGEIRLTGTWRFGGHVEGIRAVLANWTAAGEGRSASDLQLAEPEEGLAARLADRTMTNTTPDPTLDRLLGHMAWANAQLVARLLEQPADALALTSPLNEWSAGRILAHLLNAAQGYGSRMAGAPRPPDMEPVTSTAELADLGARLAAADATLRAQATEPDVMVSHPDPARPEDLRSTILAQAIHHATEHRAQIAGALATNGNTAIDLDAIDVWEHADLEGPAR